VITLGRQIETLGAETAGSGTDLTALNLRLQSLQSDLGSAQQKYGAKHPDTLRLERELKAVQDELATAPAATVFPPSAMNPDYLQLRAELASASAELQAVIAQQQSTEDKKSKIEERILKGPMIERDYIALKRDHDAAVAKYLEVRSKAAEAELTKNLETRQMGETLTLIEPPLEPIAPIKPNRRAILAIGLLAAIVSGVLFGILHDAADQRVHGWRQLAAIAGQSPFAVIPLIRTTEDRRRARRAALLQSLAGLLVLTAALLYAISFVTPMNILWAVVADHFVGAGKSPLPPGD
jgi:succinoglycan biosynthesis transport protein ExoP